MVKRNSKGKYMIQHKRLNNELWLREQYLVLYKTTTQIAKEVGCVSSTVYFALGRLEIPRRDRSEARRGIKFSKEHLENVTKANRLKAKRGSFHPNWQGGETKEWDKRMAAIKRDPDYKNWVKVVKSVGFCKSCGSVDRLEAHHILKKSTHPHLIHDSYTNTYHSLCCHATLHSKCGELLGSLEQIISSQAEAGMPQKVQRLEAESRTDSNASTSAVRETDDIVRSLQGCKVDLG